MKREILFRGINVDNCKWVEGHYFNHIDSCTNCCISDFPNFVYDVISETVGQFNGLLDKNGKKIFEGDICKRIDEKIGVIVFSNGSFLLKIKNVLTHITAFPVEIIGNIHDNTELL